MFRLFAREPSDYLEYLFFVHHLQPRPAVWGKQKSGRRVRLYSGCWAGNAGLDSGLAETLRSDFWIMSLPQIATARLQGQARDVRISSSLTIV